MFNKYLNIDLTYQNLKLLIATIVIIIVFSIMKKIFMKSVDKNEQLNMLEKSSFKRSFSLYLNIFVVLVIIVLWFSQIQSFIVSLVAVAAAVVLATKELIMSVMGGVLIKINGHFKVGDRIEVSDIRGFVVEKRLTVTKILEIGPDKFSQQTTGSLITVPNSIMLSNSVTNESYFKDYSIKSFNFKLKAGVKFQETEERVLQWANEICSPYLKDAGKMIGRFCNKEGLLIPKVEPRVKIILNDDKEFELLLKMPIRNQLIGDVEQELYRRFLIYLEE